MALVSLNVADDDQGPFQRDPNDNAPRLCLTAAQCAALGITTPPRAGTYLMLTAQCCVASVTEFEDGDDDDPDIMVTLCLEAAEISGSPSSNASLYEDG
jgi:hypothetical protein